MISFISYIVKSAILLMIPHLTVAYPEGFRRPYTGLGAQTMCPNYGKVFEIKFSDSSLNCENLCCKHFTFHKKAY